MTPLAILQKKFGYDAFRHDQERVIESVLQKRDTFVLMPTGGGKSLCYQIPSLIFSGLTVVISPLIALMKDQVDSLRLNGISADYLNSTQPFHEQNSILEKARNNELKLLYLAPERLLSSSAGTLTLLASLNVSLVAIDEAHCISQWGHDFRPEYGMLSKLKEVLPHVPIIALTATADNMTRRDIVDKLALNDPSIFVSSFNRPNIRYSVGQKHNSFQRLLEFLQVHMEESGIIYCLSRSSTETVANDLRRNGFKALPYHAGMEPNQRALHQEKFLKDEVPIIVATIAFGMGINKSNVRYVVHMDLPKNIESYYQETGRAGRDGLHSDALLLYSYADVSKLKHFAKVEGNSDQTEVALHKLDLMADYGSLNTCRRKYLLNYFGENTSDYCGNCDVCLTTVEQYDGTDVARVALRAVSDVDEKFGSGYVIDVLRGSHSIRIQPVHRATPSYGAGAAHSREIWNGIIQELVSRKYLYKTKGMYPLLTLTERSSAVLQGKERVTLTKAKDKVEIERQVDYEVGLFDALKRLRKKLAEQENVPAYVVLSDASLMEIAKFLPFNKDQFRRIQGFGEVKMQKYGKEFWEVTAAYCKERNLSSRIHLKAESRTARERVEKDSDTKRQSLDLYRRGVVIERIAAMRGLTVSTVETHLAFYIQKGQLNLEEVLSTEDISVIRRAINSAENRLYSTIKMKLGDEYTYGQIKMVMADVERQREAVQ